MRQVPPADPRRERPGTWISDPDRTHYAGPEHRVCNRGAGARNSAAVTNAGRRSDEPAKLLNPSRRQVTERIPGVGSTKG